MEMLGNILRVMGAAAAFTLVSGCASKAEAPEPAALPEIVFDQPEPTTLISPAPVRVEKVKAQSSDN